MLLIYAICGTFDLPSIDTGTRDFTDEGLWWNILGFPPGWGSNPEPPVQQASALNFTAMHYHDRWLS